MDVYSTWVYDVDMCEVKVIKIKTRIGLLETKHIVQEAYFM